MVLDGTPVGVPGELALPVQDGPDRLFELLLGGEVIRAADTQFPDGIRQLVLEHLQGPSGVAGDQNALAVGQQVGDEIGDGVGLACARRPLHDHQVPVTEPFGDRPLFVIGRQGEVELLWHGAGGRQARLPALLPLEGGRRSGAGDGAQQPGGFRPLLDTVRHALECFKHAATGAFTEDERRGESDLGDPPAGGRAVVNGAALVPPRLVSGDHPGAERLVHGAQLIRIGGVRRLQVLADALPGLGARLLLAVEHGLFESRGAVLGVGADRNGAGVRIEGDHRAAGDQMAPHGLATGRPGQIAEPDDEFIALTEVGDVLVDAVEPVVHPRRRLHDAVAFCPAPPA